MKKYLAAGAVAIMVFAFAAFAASLNLNAGTLAFGSDTVGDCGEDDTKIIYSHHNEDGFGYVDAFIVQFPDDSCDGLTAYTTFEGIGVAPETIVGDQAVYIVTTGTSVAGDNEIDGSSPRFGVPIEDITGEITVTVYSDNTPGNTGQTPPGFRTGAFA